MRKIGIFCTLLLVVLIAAVFAYNNPGSLDVDVAFTRFENVPVSVAFAAAFAVG